MTQQFPTVQELYDVKRDADDLAEIVNGNSSTEVDTRYGGTKPSISKAIADALTSLGFVTVIDNGDGTYTFNAANESVTLRDGEHALLGFSSVSTAMTAALSGKMRVGAIFETASYHDNQGVGGNKYIYRYTDDPRPAQDGGRIIHVGTDGDYFEGIFEDGQYHLSQFGAGRNDVGEDTAAIQALVAGIQSGDNVIFDVQSYYSDDDGVTITANRVDITFLKRVHVNYLDISDATYSNKPYFLRVSGEKVADLTLSSGDITEGDTSFTVADATAINPGDLIYIGSTEYFNGTDVVPGFPSTEKSIVAKVRDVDGLTVNVFGKLTMTIAAVNIIAVEVWRGGSHCKIRHPKLTGPGIQADFLNGLGSQGIEFYYATDCKLYDIDIIGFQNRQVGFVNCYSSWVYGGYVSSGLEDYCVKNFYGVMHQGGTNGYVYNLVGENLRRTADTGSGDPVVNLHHINVTGIDCNGSSCGTHHCYYYFFTNLTALGSNGGGFTIRAKNIQGNGLNGNIIAVNNGLGLGGAEDDEASCGIVDIKGINITTVDNDHVIKIFGNGSFNLEGRISGGAVSSLIAQSRKITKFKYRGTVDKLNSGIILRSTQPLEMQNIDIQHVDFLEGNWADIIIAAPPDMANRARHIAIRHNSSTSNGKPHVLFESGCVEGLGVSVVNNKNTKPWSDVVTSFVDFGDSRFTRAIEQYSNEYINYAALDGRTDFSPRILGEYTTTAAIPDKTTLPKGSLIRITDVGAAEHPYYFVTKGGTTGTLSGVTATMTAGSDIITLAGNAAFGVDVGMIIVVAGAGAGGLNLNTKVKEINLDGSEAVLNAPALSDVTNAVVTYQAPDLNGTGLL